MLEEPRDRAVAPGLFAGSAVKADMPALRRQERYQGRLRRPIITAVERTGNPRIIESCQHQRRDTDGCHEAERPAALVVIVGAGEAMARRDEEVVVCADARRA